MPSLDPCYTIRANTTFDASVLANLNTRLQDTAKLPGYANSRGGNSMVARAESSIKDIEAPLYALPANDIKSVSVRPLSWASCGTPCKARASAPVRNLTIQRTHYDSV